MVEIAPRLYLHPGSPSEVLLDSLTKGGWAIVSAAKYPWYNQAVPNVRPGHPNYYSVQQKDRLYLNMVDAADSKFFDNPMIDIAVDFIDDYLTNGSKVLVHCNAGVSRSPSIVLLYLLYSGAFSGTHDEAKAALKHIYPYYQPGPGIDQHIRENWQWYATHAKSATIDNEPLP